MALTTETPVGVCPGAFTDTFATEVVQKGSIFRGHLGGVYMFVKNAEASSAFTVKGLVRTKEATTSTEGDFVLHVTGDGGQGGPFAIAVSAIPATEFGFVLIRGRTTALYDKSGNAGSNAAAGSPIAAGDSEALHVSVAKTASNVTQDVVIATAQEAKTADADLIIDMLGVGFA